MMIPLNFPWWLLVFMLGVAFWPVTLALALAAGGLAVATRGVARGVAVVSAVAFSVVLAAAVAFGLFRLKGDRDTDAYDTATHTALAAPLFVDGLALPAGSRVEWTGVDRAHLRMAGLPRPTRLLGVDTDWISRADGEDGWDVQLTHPEVIEGWTCDKVGVHLSPTGRLKGCDLAAGRLWKAWPVPAHVPLDLGEPGKTKLALTEGSIPAPEIGHAIPATGGFSFNSDGSLDSVYFEEDDPLVVCGVRLWNTVTWVYDPASFGQGRRRRPVAIQGVTSPAPRDADAGPRNVEVRILRQPGHLQGLALRCDDAPRRHATLIRR